MYKAHQGKKEILLWCYSRTCSNHGGAKKRPLSPDNEDSSKPSKSSRYTNHVEKMTEVQVIEDKLKEVHNKDGAKVFSDEQLQTWAHLIQMGKHSSYDPPPDKQITTRLRNISLVKAVQLVLHPTSPSLQLSPYHLARESAFEANVWSNSFDCINSWKKGELARLNMTKCKNQ